MKQPANVTGCRFFLKTVLSSLYTRYPPSLHMVKDWWDKNNVKWFLRLWTITIKSLSCYDCKNKQTPPQLLIWANFITCLHPEIPSDTAFIPLILKCVQSWWVSWFMNNLGLKIVSVKMVCYCIFMLLSSKAWITLSGKDLIIAHCV